ncbi:8-amino-7-oxononanoate synthase [Rhizobium sp. R72]|uniref:8-amino-7-oxononanoate synthase n=1 Tax=unclassified Rhizobium TaxID=2613769 RepID=UPI000B536B3D|nr:MULTISPECIES: 8-amino-7-oxononanoate synthase [unclassified Rhizobium]OWW04113.1 8-amino-7-oxononanoate synthase [Rhizobium sp. R72]OWW04316.1 8-amino-7-oxononanoate synthase [Rhizobium sp. R711]
MTANLALYERKLAGLDRKGRNRSLVAISGADFTSNDYLGLADSQRLKDALCDAIDRGVPVGAGGSRLLRGNHPEHEALEQEAAAYFEAARALYFGSGYAANVALFSTLPQRDDIVVYDALIHASAHEGISTSRAPSVATAHNDVDAAADAIARWRRAGGKGRPWIAVESLYSMDGDCAPLGELMELVKRHDGFLVIDEAHATGVFGKGGRGLSEVLGHPENCISLHTCGKALGASGALVLGPAIICDFLINRARNFIYSTAPSPLMAATVREALKVLADEPERRGNLAGLVSFASREMQAATGMPPSKSQILPILIGDNRRAVRIAERLRSEGFDVRAIRPPTVPEGTARLRISITLNVDEAIISRLFERLVVILREEQQQ